MKQIIEYLPIIIFTITYFYSRDIFFATLILLIGLFAQVCIENLCGNDEKKWEEVKEISKKSIDMRIKLWTHISTEIEHEYTTN